MYMVEKIGYIIDVIAKGQVRQKTARFSYPSKVWKIWRAEVTAGTCYLCAAMNGRILKENDPILMEIPVHSNCRCYIEQAIAIAAGTATDEGHDGVDQYLAIYGTLPEIYLTQDEAKEQGWKKWKGNLAEVLPGKVIGGDVYKNWDHRLPEEQGRVWYEADFNYIRGYRNGCRLLYSNDGLIFVTYDHYLTFSEIDTEAVQ